MKKNILHIIIATTLLLALSGSLSGQTIRGVVRDGIVGTPMAGVNVLMINPSRGITTGLSGEYEFTNILVGSNPTISTGGLSKTITVAHGINWMNFWTNPPSLPSDYDGNYYHSVTIGTQTWMVENLLVTHFQTGDTISNVTSNYGWNTITTPGFSWYDNDPGISKTTYGALYNWYTVSTGNLCPTGWHVPLDADWSTLSDYLGGANIAGGKLKEVGTAHWSSPNTGATNEYGFSALPGGTRNFDGGFSGINAVGFWWSATGDVNIPTSALARYMNYYSSNVYNWTGINGKKDGFSVRCIMNMIPTLTFTSINTVSPNSAQSGGNIISDGGEPVTVRGVCWNSSPNPTILNNHTTDGPGSGIFTSSISGLSPNTTYYVKAYATNSIGTAYGNEISFTTYKSDAIKDAEGNYYNILNIGSQVWMGENLKVKKYNNGDPIGTTNPSILNIYNETSPKYQWSFKDGFLGLSAILQPVISAGGGVLTISQLVSIGTITPAQGTTIENWATMLGIADVPNKPIQTISDECNNKSATIPESFGVLYTWYAVADSRQVCPAGWRLPSDEEWTILVDYLVNNGYGYEGSGIDIAKSMAATSGWTASPTAGNVGNEQSSNNSSLFTALPGGHRIWDGTFLNIGNKGIWWSATEMDAAGVWSRDLDYGSSYLNRAYSTKNNGFSVRCLQNSQPSVTTNSISSVTQSSAQTGGNINSDGGSTIIARGVCWNIMTNPTVDLPTKTSDGTGSGSFVSNIMGLASGATYYVRAYATNSVGTSYGEEISFTTYGPDAVTDVEGNYYNTVTIGTQTWLAENLKTTKYNDGGTIPNVTDNATWDALTTPGYAWYDNNIEYKATYGALYNWYAVSTGKLCLEGWHVPTDAQLTQLTNYVGRGNVAGGKLKETGTTHWISPNEGATNEYGFTALPGGDRLLNGVFYSIGAIGSWWSSTDTLSIYAWHRFVWNNEIRFSRIYDSKTNGISVRCLKDNVNPTIVTNVNDNGPGSLRNALEFANSNPGKDTINFNIPGTGPFPIVPQTELPWITDPVFINGYSQTGSVPASSSDTARIMIRIYGTSAGTDADGLNVNAENCIINGLYISNFRFGIYLNEHGKNSVSGNLINANRNCGILVYSSDNEIGGITPASRNIIINNNVGIQLDNEAVGSSPGWGRNKIIGNFIGVDPTGNIPFGNTTGIVNVDSPDNIIGGTVKEARNVISSNGTGIRFDYFREDAVRNKIIGNYIGTNAAGSEALGNIYTGIAMNGPDNFIGDVQEGSGNLISGNGIGIHLGKRAIGNMIKGNYIGTDYSGYKAIPNSVRGIEIRDGKNNQIGGLLSGDGNLISGNSNEGILIYGEFDMGPNPADGNVVTGNYIGTDRTGLKDLANGTGIRIGRDANNNNIGGIEKEAGNIIAYNTNSGIVCADDTDPGTGNKILSNSIHSNGGLGIDLGDNGVTLSNTDTDPLDSDTGPNNLQNYPEIDSLNYTSSSVYIRGHLNSAANSSYTLQFFANKVADNTGYGEGRTYLGSKTVTTNSNGTVTFSETFSRSSGWGDAVTATATDASGNTSELSMAVGGLSDQIIAPANWPFHFRVNNEGVPRITNGSDITAVEQSFATWEKISTAKIDFESDGTTTQRNASATDHLNLVSFVDNAFPFPPRVLAIAAKTLQVSPNDDVARIIDADIVVNPEFVAHDVGVGNGDFYDAQSIITHEIGHVMGLLHTGVVNSTMFFMLGYGTKVQSLEQDDRSWASFKYPGASYNSTFGSISGHIRYGYGGDPVAGALVMAIRTSVTPLDTVHAYSDADGNYLVPGLPAGTYNIYIQPLDGSVNEFNLRPGNISIYIYCNTVYIDYPGEFLSTNESDEESTDPPLSLNVSAGSNTIAGDITTNRDITPPTLVQVRPTDPDGEKIKVLSDFIIKFSESVDESTLTSQTCYLELATTSGPRQFGGIFSVLPDSTNIIVFNPDSVLRFSKIYTLHLTSGIQDLKENPLTVPAPLTFTSVDRDLVAPTIKGTYPVNGVGSVLVASDVKVMFSEPMNTGSVNDNFALTWIGGTPAVTNKVDGSITWDAEKATLTFTPSQSLGEGTHYTITVSTGATDLSGNHMATANNFTFSTVDVAVPVVKYLGPTNSQTGVTIETPVVADFSEAIDPLSVTSSAFSLKLSGSQALVDGDFEFLNGNARVVFRPLTNLSPGSVYTATLTTGIKDVSPTISTLAANVISTFTTAPTPSAPTITFLDPPRGTVKVGFATAVTISGTGFDPSPSKNLISFNGITAFTKTATLSTLTTEVPIGTMSGPVTVTVNGRTSNQMQFDVIPDYINDPDYTTSNKSLPSGSSGGSAVSGSGEAVFAMVTNPENNSVTRIGLGTSGTFRSIPTGGLYPVKVDIDPQGKYAYVTNYFSHDVTVINLATNQVFKIIPAGVGPYGVAVTSDGKRVYVSNYESGNLSLIDVDPTSGGFDHVVANVPTGSNPGNIAVTADAGMVLVTGPFGLKIVDSNPKSVDYNSITATVSSGTRTTDVTTTADAGFAIVATGEGNLLIVNLHPANDDYSGAVVANVPTGTNVSDVKASGDAVYVYATDTENDQILVYKFSGGATGLPSGSGAQGITLTHLDPVPVPDGPTGLNISPSGDKIYTITSLSSSTRQVTTISLTGLIISPENSIQSLISTVQIMIDNASITRLRGEILIVTLNSALRNVTAGRTKLAIVDLNAFIALVKTYIKNKQVSAAQGNALVDAATAIINQLKVTKSEGEEYDYFDAEKPVPEPVTETKLGVIYPNPSRDAITINYEVAYDELNSGKVMIKVYDVIGRVVANLVNSTQEQGRYSITWSATSEDGNQVPRGVYFIRLKAGKVEEVRQIMLVR